MKGEIVELCLEPISHLRRWPGQGPDYVCDGHADDTAAIWNAMGQGGHLAKLNPKLLKMKLVEVGIHCACSAGRLHHVILNDTAIRKELLRIVMEGVRDAVGDVEEEIESEAEAEVGGAEINALAEWWEQRGKGDRGDADD